MTMMESPSPSLAASSDVCPKHSDRYDLPKADQLNGRDYSSQMGVKKQQQQQRKLQVLSSSVQTIKKVLDERDNKCHPRLAAVGRSPTSDCWTNVTEAISSFSELDDEFDGGEDDGNGEDGEQHRVMVTLLSASMTMTSFDDTVNDDDSQSTGGSLLMTSGNDRSTLISSVAPPRASTSIGSNKGRLVSTHPCTDPSRDGSVSNTWYSPAISTTSVSASRSTWGDNTTTCAAATGAILYQRHGNDDDSDNDSWDEKEEEGIPPVITLIHDEYYDNNSNNNGNPMSGNNSQVRCSDTKGGRDLSIIFHRRSSVASGLGGGSGDGGCTSAAVLLRQVDGVEGPTSSADEDVDMWKLRLDRAEALVVSYRAVLQSQDHLVESLEQTLSEVRDSAQDLVFDRDRLSQELDDTLDEQDDALNRILTERANKVAAPRVVVLGLSLLYYLCGGTEYLLMLASTFCLLEDLLTVCFPCT